MIDTDLFSHLSTNVEQVDGRVYPLIRPQDSEVPSIVYTIIDDADKQRLNGAPYGFKQLVQVDVYADSYSMAKSIKDAVNTAIYSFEYYPYDFRSKDDYESDTKLFRQLIQFYLKG